VYVYSIENYEFWMSELGRNDFTHGQFGENFTVEGMLDDEVCVGDIFRIGGALVEVSQPRIPCYKLAIKMGIDGFQNRFLKSGRVGFYFRVLEEGEVGAGDAIELVHRQPNAMPVRDVSNLLFFDKSDLDGTKQALSIPALSHGWKGSFEERLVKAETSTGTGFRTFTVDRKVPESETITSFYLVPEDGASLGEFLPGQFLTFKLTIPGQPEPVIRTYSLSDSPNRDYYRVSIKREPPPPDQPDAPPGLSSNYFHDHVDVGTTLSVGPPRGKFHLNRDSARSVVLLSGGVGLTPMISMMSDLTQSDAERPVWFIHGVRNGREHAMGEHVRRMVRENENVNAHIRYSDPSPDDTEGRDYDSTGYVDMRLLKQVLPFDDYEFYLCGPPPFMKSLYCGLLSLGVAESRIHYEFFGPASVLTEEAAPSGQAPARSAENELTGEMDVTFARSGLTAAWDTGCETILDLAEHHGLSPPYSCRSGICHTCMCELVEGEVEYIEEPLELPDAGQVLICCSRPKSKLVIEV
jgi:ferredoxin-NADP reductase/MOSC domain-containing protein YiiM